MQCSTLPRFLTDRKTSRAALLSLRSFLSPLSLLCSCFCGSHCVCVCFRKTGPFRVGALGLRSPKSAERCTLTSAPDVAGRVTGTQSAVTSSTAMLYGGVCAPRARRTPLLRRFSGQPLQHFLLFFPTSSHFALPSHDCQAGRSCPSHCAASNAPPIYGISTYRALSVVLSLQSPHCVNTGGRHRGPC